MAGIYDNPNAVYVGLGMIVAGRIAKGIGTAVQEEADIRYWDNLPGKVFGYTMFLPESVESVDATFLNADGTANGRRQIIPIRTTGSCRLAWARSGPTVPLSPRAPFSASESVMNQRVTVPPRPKDSDSGPNASQKADALQNETPAEIRIKESWCQTATGVTFTDAPPSPRACPAWGRHIRRLGGTLLLLTLLPACQQMEPAPLCNMDAIVNQRTLVSVPATVPGQVSPLQEMPLNLVTITDHNIINKIYIRSVNARRTPSGTAEVYAQVINCTDSPLQTEARIQFYDANQTPSEPVSAWKRLHLPPRSSNTYQAFSLGTYRVKMQEGR
ncbi:MAG: hypothetical protein FD153_1648 [Rhodospirillaceae bacterium]|nr:MAG: hypothetical protein FD153_1648 [Rhodospirillaceae bacterium]